MSEYYRFTAAHALSAGQEVTVGNDGGVLRAWVGSPIVGTVVGPARAGEQVTVRVDPRGAQVKKSAVDLLAEAVNESP